LRRAALLDELPPRNSVGRFRRQAAASYATAPTSAVS